MGFQRKYLFKYIAIISYVLKACFNRTKSQVILKTIVHDLRIKILFGSEISFKCVPDNVLEMLLAQSYDNESILKHYLQIDKCLFVSQETLNKFKLENIQWVLVNVKTRNSYSLPVLHYNRIIVLNNFKETECLLTSTNLFNLCNCDNNLEVQMLRIIKPLIDYEPKITQKVSISVMKPVLVSDKSQTLLDKVIYNYFSIPKFVSVGDILKLDLIRCYPEAKYLEKPSNISFVYIKIVESEKIIKKINFYNCKSNFYISNLGTKLTENTCLFNTYLPMKKECAINDLKKLNINNYNDFIINIFPDGMEDEKDALVSWIKPFVQQTHKVSDFRSLKPTFLIYGANGCGEKLLIDSVSQYLGIRYIYQCCFEWPLNNITQFKKKIEYFFDDIRKKTPCLLHLGNVEAFCLCSTKDLQQEVLDIFTTQINAKTDKPIIIIATTNSIKECSPVFLRIFLECRQVGNLSNINCYKLLRWMLKRDCIALDNTIIEKIVNHTSGFNYMNYMTLLLLSTKYHMHITTKSTEIILNESDIMPSIDKINAMFAKSIDAPKIEKVKWENVGGLLHVRQEIMSSLKPSKHNMRRSGILLYGPPGTGKTLLAKAVATECSYNFLSVKGPELLNMYVGQSEINVREVFNKARSAAPCIIFFDELDSLAPKRGENGNSGAVINRVVAQLLTEMDGMTSKNEQIFVLGATNRQDLIDPALLRPGRLDKSIYVGACTDKESKLHVLKALTKNFNLHSNFHLEDLINHLPQQVTGAELYGLCQNAWLNRIRKIIHQRHKNDKPCTSTDNLTELIIMEEDFLYAMSESFVYKMT